MNQPCNAVIIPRPQNIFSRSEVDSIMSVVSNFLSRTLPNTVRGTIVIRSQRFGQPEEPVARWDLSAGPFNCVLYDRPTSSTQIANQAIDELVAIPGNSRYTSGTAAGRESLRSQFRKQFDVYTGIYQDHELMALLLNASGGRILAGCAFQSEGDNLAPHYSEQLSIAVLYGIGQGIIKLRPSDRILQGNGASLLEQVAANCGDVASALCVSMRQLVDDLYDGNIPSDEIKKWREWRRLSNANRVHSLFP